MHIIDNCDVCIWKNRDRNRSVISKERKKMIRDIVKDTFFLQRKSVDASKEDVCVAMDLIDTLRANQYRCVGMAANMIGKNKNIIAFLDGKTLVLMMNPKLIQKKGKYICEEGCLSLEGTRQTERYHEIVVQYMDMQMHKHTKKYSGYVAEIIQHEMDHLVGILI